ncbi:hypothetical protein HDK77DRAFT_58050 [Phyllosticta capitalensis]
MPSSDQLSPLQSALEAPRDRQSCHSIQDQATKDQKAPEDQKHQVHIQEVERSSSLQEPARKRKRSEDVEDVEVSPSTRRQRFHPQPTLGPGRSPPPFPLYGDTAPNAELSPSPTGQESPLVPDPEGLNQENGDISDPVDFWRKHHAWPSTYSESDASAQMNVRRSPSLKSVRSHNNKKFWALDISDSGSDSPETRKRYMNNGTVTTYLMLHSQEYPQGLPETAETLLQRLRTEEQTVPAIWDDAAVLSKVSKRTKNRSEGKVVVDVGHLVLPRVDHFYYFDDSFEYLAESCDESWSQCVPLLGSTCPKPYYAAGFHWNAAFSDPQIKVLQTLGPDRSCTFFRTTIELYFPFLTAEAKSGTGTSAAEAEKQNVETTLIAMRGVIELFRQAKQDDKIHMQILAFSVVYDNTTVSIYAHFADVRPYYPKFYRHNVGDFLFPTEVWASHKFIKNIYKIWVPFHHKRICDAIEVLAKNGLQSPVPLNGDAPHSTSPGSNQEAASDPVDYWRKHHFWPSSYFESENGHEAMSGPQRAPSQMPSQKSSQISRRDANKAVWKHSFSVPASEYSTSTGIRKGPLGRRNVQYFLLDNSEELPQGLPASAKNMKLRLETENQEDPMFLHDSIFARIHQMTRKTPEAKIVSDVGPLVVPHLHHLYYLGDDSLVYLTESFDQPWSHCIPSLGSNCPTPDYAVGFDFRKAFTRQQRAVLKELEFTLTTNFHLATEDLAFPFFTCEAKESCAAPSLEEAQFQNVETSLIAMRGLIELFQRAKSQHLINQEILTFSAIYNDRDVHIYAHFADVYSQDPVFYRHQIGNFEWVKSKWTTFKLIKNIYKIWAPIHYQRICEAIRILGTPSSAPSNASFPAAAEVLNAPHASPGGAPKPSSSATGGAPGSRASPMAPPPPRSSASGTDNVQS